MKRSLPSGYARGKDIEFRAPQDIRLLEGSILIRCMSLWDIILIFIDLGESLSIIFVRILVSYLQMYTTSCFKIIKRAFGSRHQLPISTLKKKHIFIPTKINPRKDYIKPSKKS